MKPSSIVSHPRLACLCLAAVLAPVAAEPLPFVKPGDGGGLRYVATEQGDRIIDFSHAGYGGGGCELPLVPVRIVVGPGEGDAGGRIQAAIDRVSALPMDPGGWRGAVLLAPGVHPVAGSLRIAADGVVLRGSGEGEGGTVLLATGTSRRPLIVVGGTGGPVAEPGAQRRIIDARVPAGAMSLTLEDAAGLSAGDRVLVRRPCTASWISLLGMDRFKGWRAETRLNWQPGSRDIVWDRAVTAVDGNRVTLDAPLTTALEQEHGGGVLERCSSTGRIRNAGVENLRCVSAFDPARPMDEDHAWTCITLGAVEDAWVRQVTAEHFACHAVNAGRDSLRVTVEDCTALAPVSEIGGHRRRVFFTQGQRTLFQRCRSSSGRHDFGAGFAAAGPDVFHDCDGAESLDFSGPLESWASGILYDNVRIRGNALRLTDRDIEDQGCGWAAANCLLWNCEATDIEVRQPPGACNLACGCMGVVSGDGIVEDPRAVANRDFYRGGRLKPGSLYLAQLAERLGPDAPARIARRDMPPDAGDAPRLTPQDVEAWRAAVEAAQPPPEPPLKVEDGHFTIGGRRAWTERVMYSWFQGQLSPAQAPGFGPAVTRFAPGREGTGFTDRLGEVVAGMAPGAAFYQHYGLWYDRRRVNHNFYGSPGRRTGDVWPPFMELPWARSGTGRAWDGLSLYDLSRYNPWYFDRVREFAGLCDRGGRILYNIVYFQHWLLESRAHYVDFPWRPVNCIQQTGMPGEVPAAATFYNLSDPVRRELHRSYIRHCLDNLKDNTNVVHGIDREYTGPVEFVKFWLDVIAEWERENGRQLFISLELPKDQTDELLDDPVYGPMITAIDFHGWVYRPDGTLFAIRGGLDLAPRQQNPGIVTAQDRAEILARTPGLDEAKLEAVPEFQARMKELWDSTPPMRYRAWREYRDARPGLVVLTEQDEYPELTRAVEALVPREARARTRPAPLVLNRPGMAWCMADPGKTCLVYDMDGGAVELDLSGDPSTYAVHWLDPQGGGLQHSRKAVRGGRVVTLSPPAGGSGRPWVAWLTAKPESSTPESPVQR